MRATDCCPLWCNPEAIPENREFTGKQRQIEAKPSGKIFAGAGIFTNGGNAAFTRGFAPRSRWSLPPSSV